MSSRQKRSSGGYGLRRKIAKKRLDEDFEYYFSKIGTHLDPSTKSVKEQKIHTHLVMVTELVDSGSKSEMKIESSEKRPRGRPKKIQPNQSEEIDFSDSALRLVELKEKRAKKIKSDYLDEAETTKAVYEICPRNEAVMTVACEEEVEHVDCIVKRVKLDSVLSADGITSLQEEEVSSLPEGEKENLPEDGIHLEPESDSEEVLGMKMDLPMHGDIEERTIFEEDDPDKDPGVLKMKRKYKRGRLSQDAIQKLSQLSPDDKIECSECHKLLKPSSFRQHLRTHTGLKPFGCDVCDARFTRKGDVERHVRIVHNKQKPFKCCRCQRAFGDKKNLRWHLMNHDKKLFYVCEVCGFKFGKREYWENHVRFIHPIPGGVNDLDETNITEEVEGEDRLRTLTKTLLGEDESAVDDPSQDCVAAVKSIQNKEQDIDECNAMEISLPLIEQGSKPEGLKIINVLKVRRPKMSANLQPFTRVINQNQGGGIEAVVIQFDGSNSGNSGTLHSLQPVSVSPRYRQHLAPNLIHVVDSENVLQLVETEQPQNDHSIVIETQEYENSALNDTETATIIDCPSDVIQEQVVEVEGGLVNGVEGEQGTIQYVTEGGDEEPSKVISIMLSEDGSAGSDANSSSVQTLIEALLVAAKGEGGQDTT